MAGARPPDAAAARRFCALPRDLQGSAGRTREGPCGGCGRAGGSAGANGHGPPPMAAFAAARAHGRAFASFLCTIAAGVRGGGTGRRFLTPHPMAARSHRFCARSPQPCGGGGTGWRFPTPHPMAARSRRSNSYRAQGGFAPTAAVRRRRAPLRSRSAPRAGRGPRGRSGRRPRSAGRWGGAGRASR